MGIFDIFRSKDSTSKMQVDPRPLDRQTTDPLVMTPASIIGGRAEEQFNLRDLQGRNRYLMADNLYISDERLYSAIELIALMIQKSIGDTLGNIFTIRSDDRQLTNEEENAIEVANEFARTLDGVGIPRLFYHYTIDLWKYGDAVDEIHLGSSGVEKLQPLPMHLVTAIDTRSQLNRAIDYNEPAIMNPKWYVVDEQMSETNVPDMVIKKERVTHISFNNRRNWIKDNLNRWTFGVWSYPPIYSLIGILTWKQQLIRNDMIWRNRSLPREWHKLDLSNYDASKFSGTHEQKLAAAQTAANNAIKDYAKTNQRREADQGFVTGGGVEISYVEPSKTTYSDPSPIIDQINSLIGGPTGTPAALMGGESKGFTSLVHASSFLALRAEVYSNPIQRAMEDLTKRHVSLARPGIRKEVVDRLYMKNRLILDRDRSELAKMVAILTASKVFTPDEIRAIWGLDPATEKQAKEIIGWLKSTSNASKSNGGLNSAQRTQAQMISRREGTEGTATRGQESQRQRERNTFTTGDRTGEA